MTIDQSKDELRKGRLVAAILSGSWRKDPSGSLAISAADLDEVTPLLCRSGAAALGWRRISHTPLRATQSAEVLQQSYRLQSLQSDIHEHKVEKAFRVLRQASIDALLVKGWAASRLYTQSDLRPVGDMDLCVRPEQFELAKQVLSGPDTKDCFVDLHRELSEISDRPLEGLFARAQVIKLGEEKIKVLSREDHLALLCIHLLKHGAWRPLWLCDICAGLESLPTNFDWNIFTGGNKRSARWIHAAIGLGRHLLGLRVEHLPLKPKSIELPSWFVQTVLLHWSRLYPGDQLPMTPAPLMVNTLMARRDIVKAITARWPDPITATFDLGGQFNRMPRFPYQMIDFAWRTTRFVFELPAKLQAQLSRN